MRVSTKELVCLVLLVLPAFSPAEAALTISSAPTANVTCAKAGCTATAADAVLNVGYLRGLLAKGSVKVATGTDATDIVISAPLTWISANTLMLDAYHSVVVNKPISVSGVGGVTIHTNDGGKGGTFSFDPKGNITFWNLSSYLKIDGKTYTLVNNISTLASDINSDPNGNYAWATNYDASADGTYTDIPITTDFERMFEGLGNTISKLSITVQPSSYGPPGAGLFENVSGTIENLRLLKVSIFSGGPSIGALTLWNHGILRGDTVSGRVGSIIALGKNFSVGGLVSANVGTIANCGSNVSVSANASTHSYMYVESLVGGIAGDNAGTIVRSFARGHVGISRYGFAGGLVGQNEDNSIIRESYATGSVTGRTIGKSEPIIGGLVGWNGSLNVGSRENIVDSYATGTVTGSGIVEVGGLVGENGGEQAGTINSSYSTAAVTAASGSPIGGFAAVVGGPTHSIKNSYWDTTASGATAGTFYGSSPGITGLTTVQLQSGLPTGFDPSIWGENPSINGGLPYLLGNPPT